VGLCTQNFHRGGNYTALKWFSVTACSVGGARQPVPVTCPHCIAQSHSYANSIWMPGKAGAAARVDLFLVWICKIGTRSNFSRIISPAGLLRFILSKRQLQRGQEEKAKRGKVCLKLPPYSSCFVFSRISGNAQAGDCDSRNRASSFSDRFWVLISGFGRAAFRFPRSIEDQLQQHSEFRARRDF